MASDSQVAPKELTGPTCMQSVNRITKLPAVESTIQTATNIYGSVKDYNRVTNWSLTTAESTVNKVVEVGKPILTTFEGPIKTVDDVLCSGLDYVESKVPTIKLPPNEILLQIYSTLVTPAVDKAHEYAEQAKIIVEPRIKQARDLVDPVILKLEPAVEATKTMVQPTIEAAKHIVEPIVQPALEKVSQLKVYGQQKVEEFCQKGHSKDGEGLPFECEECQDVRDKVEKKSSE